jgi:hypothetical protein
VLLLRELKFVDQQQYSIVDQDPCLHPVKFADMALASQSTARCSFHRVHRKLRSVVVSSAVATGTSSSSRTTSGPDPTTARQRKDELLSWISGTKRGSNTTKQLRGQIEEAQVHATAGV